MSDVSSAKLLVLVEDNSACVKICGRATFASSIDFKSFVNRVSENGCHRIVVDLSDCQLMDSTFLGVLAGLALKMNGTNGAQQSRIDLHNPNPRIAEILENLGVLGLFNVVKDAPEICNRPHASMSESSNPSREEVKQTCLDAHNTLMSVNPDNVPRFKDVARFLAEDLKKIKAGA